MARYAESRGSSFIGGLSSADEILQEELQDQSNIPNCWAWLKKRGYMEAHCQGSCCCDVTQLMDCEMDSHMVTQIAETHAGLFNRDWIEKYLKIGMRSQQYSKSFTKQAKGEHTLDGVGSGTTFGNERAGAYVTQAWMFITMKRCPGSEQASITPQTPQEMADLIRNIAPNNRLYDSYASRFFEMGIDAIQASHLSEDELRTTFQVGERVHRLRILEEIGRLRTTSFRYDLTIGHANRSFYMKWSFKLWVHTFSPPPNPASWNK